MAAAISWSGGKDGWLALARARERGRDVRVALTMFDEDGERSRSHAVAPDVMAAQALALGLAPVAARTAWARYEDNIVAALRGLAADGVDTVIFGDIDIAAHRAFEERVCAAAGLTAELPLWQQDRRALVDEMFARGLEAVVVVTNGRWLDVSMCGRRFDAAYVAALPPEVDACGENGEFHTFVTDGAGFATPLAVAVDPAYSREIVFEGAQSLYHVAPLRLAARSPLAN